MKLACFFKDNKLKSDRRPASFITALRDAGFDVYETVSASDVIQGTSALLSLGGDGTFLAAARIAVPAGIPVLGVNFGRLGFLSECDPDAVVAALESGDFSIEQRRMLKLEVKDSPCDIAWPYALNEVAICRKGSAMLGVDVHVNGEKLPTYWADGLLVATSSGSTAYSLSVGGPICLPDSRVLIVAPIAPHNLNLRPLIVPEESDVEISFRSRSEDASLSIDSEMYTVPEGTTFTVRSAEVKLSRLRIRESNFIDALSSRLLWGLDVRNSEEN